MSKTLCKLDQSADRVKSKSRKPHFICKKCERVAAKKKWLCKPVKLAE